MPRGEKPSRPSSPCERDGHDFQELTDADERRVVGTVVELWRTLICRKCGKTRVVRINTWAVATPGPVEIKKNSRRTDDEY